MSFPSNTNLSIGIHFFLTKILFSSNFSNFSIYTTRRVSIVERRAVYRCHRLTTRISSPISLYRELYTSRITIMPRSLRKQRVGKSSRVGVASEKRRRKCEYGKVTAKCSSNYRYALGKRLPCRWSVFAVTGAPQRRRQRYLLEIRIFRKASAPGFHRWFTRERREKDGMSRGGGRRGGKKTERGLTFALGNFITSRTDVATSSLPSVASISLFDSELVVLWTPCVKKLLLFFTRKLQRATLRSTARVKSNFSEWQYVVVSLIQSTARRKKARTTPVLKIDLTH